VKSSQESSWVLPECCILH